MELVEGEDLAERLKRGAIPVDEAVAIAKQVAEALEEAHEKGIVHRDLKPGEREGDAGRQGQGPRLRPRQGLDAARARGVTSSADLSQSPTLAHTGTAAGLILGTAAYMSPEQARGKAVDKRADVWAFGVVLFEMLTGRRLFDGETVSDVARRGAEDGARLGRSAARHARAVRQLLGRCLERDPKQRLRDIGEARVALGGRDVGRAAPACRPRPRPPRGDRPRAWAALALVAARLRPPRASGLCRAFARPPPRAVTRLSRSRLPPGQVLSGNGGPAISRDGRALAYAARDATGVVAALPENARPLRGERRPRERGRPGALLLPGRRAASASSRGRS